MSEIEQSPIHADLPAAASLQGLIDRKELAGFAFQRTRMPMVVTDARQPDMPIVLANDAFLKLTGYSSDEILGQNCRFLQGEATSRSTVAEIRAAIAAGRQATVEILNYRKHGSAFWNQLHFSPIHDENGALVYYFASQVDVTEYRRIQTLEEAEHRLLLEVDHRTKNVLAIVDSVVRLSRSDDATAYAASVQRRVQALSRTHALLAEHGWKGVELADIIHTQTDSFEQDRVDIDGAKIVVPAPSVQPIGLAIHELAANAAVHGALSGKTGTLTIRWTATVGGGLELQWTEQGGPPPLPTSDRGFGHVLLSAVVERQLGGRIMRDWRDTGLLLAIGLPSLDRVGTALHARP